MRSIILSALFSCVIATALDDYVAKADSNYVWTDTGKNFKGPGYTGHVLNMTSQQWLTPQDVDRSIWWHIVVVVIPEINSHPDKGALYLTGGDQNDGLPDGTGEDELLCIALALFSEVTCTVVHHIPNEHIKFLAELPTPKERTEDGIIAYAWNHFLAHPDQPEWLPRLPMTKAAVRAMDCTYEFVKNISKIPVKKTQWIVAGASKRGWTTWTTGAVCAEKCGLYDHKAIGIIPIVMDALNFHTNVHHFWQALGGWTFALSDYYEQNFTRNIDHPNLPLMTAIIDPINYKDRLTMPKLVIDSTGDEFFMPDDNYYWWNQSLPGELHLLMVHNAEHSMVTGLPEVVQGASSFMNGILNQKARPSMTWTMDVDATGGSTTVITSETPTKIIVRHAETLDGLHRDFRLVTGYNPCSLPRFTVKGLCIQPVFWHNLNTTQTAPNTYTIRMENLADRWRAFVIEVEFRGTTRIPYVFTTQVNIIPQTFPFPPCVGEGCYGTLL